MTDDLTPMTMEQRMELRRKILELQKEKRHEQKINRLIKKYEVARDNDDFFEMRKLEFFLANEGFETDRTQADYSDYSIKQ